MKIVEQSLISSFFFKVIDGVPPFHYEGKRTVYVHEARKNEKKPEKYIAPHLA
jgi:hypothetical protein